MITIFGTTYFTIGAGFVVLALAAPFLFWFARWLWRPNVEDKPRRVRWLAVGGTALGLLLLLAVGLFWDVYLIGQRAKELSGGNQQKVCLAKAFAIKPHLLFVSEPTRGIDVGAKKLVLDALHRSNREEGTTIVMISSELEELRSVCDRIAIVSEGRVAGILPPHAELAEFGLLMAGERVAQEDRGA